MASIIPVERIERSILMLRGHRVMLDADIAELYGVPTKRLNEQVKRNRQKFPEDFMFRLTAAEVEQLNRSQFATGSQKHRDPRFPPYAFTEHGAIMAANVLNSKRAVGMSVEVVRTFIRLRQLMATHADLERKLDSLEKKYDHQFKVVFDAIRQLMTPPETPRKRMGFNAD